MLLLTRETEVYFGTHTTGGWHAAVLATPSGADNPPGDVLPDFGTGPRGNKSIPNGDDLFAHAPTTGRLHFGDLYAGSLCVL